MLGGAGGQSQRDTACPAGDVLEGHTGKGGSRGGVPCWLWREKTRTLQLMTLWAMRKQTCWLLKRNSTYTFCLHT